MFRAVIQSTFLLAALFSLGLAQSPPPPLIYEPPIKTDIVKFEAEDKSFKAEFPSTPASRTGEVEGIRYSSFTTYRMGSNSSITVFYSTRDLSGPADDVLALLKANLLKRERAKLVAEREITLGGGRGIELEVDYGLRHGLSWFLVSGLKFYVIECDVTNWSILDEKTKGKWRAEATRFYSSISIAN